MKRYSTIMSVLLTLALPVAGHCADAPKAPEKADSSVEASKDVKQKDVKPAEAQPKKTAAPAAAAAAPVNANPAGKVVETMNGGGYTYANIEKDGKKTWVAFPALETRVGDTLSFTNCMEMPGFQSKALNRKFDSILFCGAPEVAAKPVAAKAKSPGSTGAASAAGKSIKVEKADGPNAYTVSEIFAKRGALNGKQVVVSGEVVKVASGIMNRNWIHLQDGTGSEKKKDHDLVVTSSELPEVGQVVTFSGTIAKDKDFGGGYKYGVILEKGSLKK
ncbi:MAG TPA: DNA-binding protein [Geobacter sp.]|nr:DNA-binding protein [Geobacter sp.]